MTTEKLTPMLKQFLYFKEKHPDKLLLFRMGDFYETFFDDAKLTAKTLGITLTSRNKKDDEAIPLAGFPYHALDNYLEKLIKAGLKVAICEQVEDPKLAKGIVKRDIIDIITPGTVLENDYLNGAAKNFLGAIYLGETSFAGLAALDISTGEFIFTQVEKDRLKQEILKLDLAELVFCSEEQAKNFAKNDLNLTFSIHQDAFERAEEAKVFLDAYFGFFGNDVFSDRPLGTLAAALALRYVQSLKTDNLLHINKINYFSPDEYLQIDEATRRNLELLRSLRDNGRQGSLSQVLDTTLTPMGARLFTDWLLHPLLDKQRINKRQKAVQAFLTKYHLCEKLRSILKEVGDISRLISKCGALRVNPRELVALASYLQKAPLLKNCLGEIGEIHYVFPQMENLVTFILSSLTEDPPLVITDGNVIAAGYNKELDELKHLSRDQKQIIAGLERKEREETKIPSLKINYNKVFGYYIEVTKTHAEKVPFRYIRKQTLVNCERFISPELKELETKVLGAEERIKQMEYEFYGEIRQKVLSWIPQVQDLVEIIAEIDVLAAFAYTAYNNNYVKPTFNDNGILEIYDSRHPVVEKLVRGEDYIPNDVYLDDDTYKIALITGPNMAGKSTYLRQIALIAVMAQIGSFVPASKANLPVFDKVFTRVGASDNLAQGQSTFYVEMLETANILNSATQNSLIILDEIGRGTSTFDGLSLAWAIVEYIHNHPKLRAKTLFATHYHELTELENMLPGVKNYNIEVKHYNGEMIFLRKITRGGADQSYGIAVASLAGVPEPVIKRAQQILKNLEEHELSPQGLGSKAFRELTGKSQEQTSIFEIIFADADMNNKIVDELKQIDVNKLTPLEALQLLSRWTTLVQ